ncbi:MAG: choice-of-anchor J domain-containing protein [Flavobacterium sp.]|nr:choice-of-anchor J domain-containing protein [Flavobacterium sp.]
MKLKLLYFMLFISISNYSQFSQSFEGATTVPVGWSVINGGDVTNTWTGISLAASYGLQAQNGTNCFTIAYDAAAHDDYLITPQVAVTAGTSDKLSFWGRSRDANYPETISVRLSTTTATASDFTVTLLATVAPISGSNFYKYTVDLTPYVGSNIYIGFRSTTTDKFYFDIDNIVVGGTPMCGEPVGFLTFTNQNSATPTVSWNAPSMPASYWIYVSTSGAIPTGPPTYMPLNMGATSFNLPGLVDNTKYYVYIKSNCGMSGSVFSSLGVLNYITPKTPPYTYVLITHQA